MTLPAARQFRCIDAHTCGNPVRLVVEGTPALEGDTMLDRRAHFLAEYDWIRTALMYEPRGHAMMSGSMLYPATRADCDIGVLFIETSGCLPMCGHGTIGTVTIAVEKGLVYALAQPLVDRFGVAGGRGFTALLGLLTAVGAARLAARSAPGKGAASAALIAFLLIAVNVYQVYFTTIKINHILHICGFSYRLWWYKQTTIN